MKFHLQHLNFFWLNCVLVSLQACHTTDHIIIYNSAVEYQRVGDTINALSQYKSALNNCLPFPEAHQNIALVYEQFGDVEMCRHHHTLSIKYAENDIFKSFAIINLVNLELKAYPYPSHSNLILLDKLLDEARHLNPGEATVELVSGFVNEMIGQADVALHKFEQALVKDSNFSLALLNIGNHHFKRNDFAQATDFYARTIASMAGGSRQELLQAYCNLGQSLRESGLVNSALDSFLEAYKILDANSLRECRGSLSSSGELFVVTNIIAVQTMLCRWQNLELLEDLVTKYLRKLATTRLDIRALRGEDHYGIPLTTAVEPYTISLFRHGTHDTDLTASRSVCVALPNAFNSSDERRIIADSASPLRVGYLSVDWRNHPMGRLTGRLVTSHNASRVQAECFSYGQDDGSSVRREVQSRARRFRDLRSVPSPLDAAQIVSEARLDILVDLTTHTFNGRVAIAALKPASIVIGYLGFAGTSGCAGFDYALVDRVVAPPETAHQAFSERLAFLPHSYQTNDMPMEVEPCTRGRAACRLERRLISASSLSLHLREAYDEERYYAHSTLWMCSFNANKKMEPVSFGVWMSVLTRVPSAVLVLLDVTADTKVEIILATEYHGVSANRVLFVEKETWYKHLHRSAACDLVLDTFVYGAHTTASDMLWMHVPVLALASFGADRMPSRVAGSLLRSLRTISADSSNSPARQWHSDMLGLLVVPSVKMYEESAVRLLGRLGSLAALHDALGDRVMRSPTFDARTIQNEMEFMYQAVYEVYQLTRDSPLHSLPHIVQLSSASSSYSDERATSSMRRDGEEALLRQIASMKGEVIDDDDHCIHKVSGVNFLAGLEQLVFCSGHQTRSLHSWSGVVAVASRLLIIAPPDSTYSASLQTLIKVCTVSPLTVVVEEKEDKSSLVSEPLAVLEEDPSSSPLDDTGLLSHALLSAESLQADIRAIYAIAAKDFKQLQMIDLRNLLQQYLLVDGPAALNIFLDALQSLSLGGERDCEAALSLFEVVQPLLFSLATHADFVATRSQNTDVADILLAHSKVVTATLDAVTSLDVARVAFAIDWASMNEKHIEVLLTSVLLPRLIPTKHQNLFVEMKYSFIALDNSLDGDALSNLLFVHAVCLNQGSLSSDLVGLQYAMTTLSALRLSSSAPMDQLRNAGVALMDLGCSEIGHLITSVASLKLHQRRFVSHLQVELMSPSVRASSVAIFCEEYDQAWWPGWGPSAIGEKGRGMGGSEEAVVYLAAELAHIGYQVVIYADIPQSDVGVISHRQDGGGTGRVQWLHCSNYDVSSPHDVFIAWRYSVSFLVGAASRVSYLWLHDLLAGHVLPPSLFSLYSGLLVQSDFHNAPNRGLDLVLQSWAAIKARLPSATLEVYYGFTSAVERHMKGALGAEGYQLWIDRMHALLKQDGVRYYGTVDHARLTEAYQRAGFLLYPTTFQETGCITALRAMAAGAIPVTSRLRESVLFKLTDGFDLGPEKYLDLDTANDETKLHAWLREEWVEAVVRASLMDATFLTDHRERMAAVIRQRSTWRSTAESLDELFDRHLSAL